MAGDPAGNMTRLPLLIGSLLGVLAAIGVLAVEDAARRKPPELATVQSDGEGPISELVIQYLPEADEIVLRVYRQFLRELPARLTVHVVCPDQAAFDRLARLTAPVACKLVPVLTGHEMTCWSRDRWLALALGDQITLLRPRGEDGAAIWRARAGDQLIAEDLARTLPRVRARRSTLYFDGGDFVVDGDTVFVTPDVARRNIQHTVRDRAQLLRRLRQMLGRKRVILLDKAPPHHAGMFMMPAGHKTMLVGDPALGRKLLGADPLPAGLREIGADFGRPLQALFDHVARRCREAGYRVVRMPILPGADGRTYVTYLNVILDQRAGQRTVYMPTFRGARALDLAATRIWRRLGYTVRPIDCSATYQHYGSLRCLVNVLRRGPNG